MVRKIVKDIKTNEPSGAYFDAAHMAASMMFYPNLNSILLSMYSKYNEYGVQRFGLIIIPRITLI